jgi:hypothetical protein
MGHPGGPVRRPVVAVASETIARAGRFEMAETFTAEAATVQLWHEPPTPTPAAHDDVPS